jgi:micrococcal nuclease
MRRQRNLSPLRLPRRSWQAAVAILLASALAALHQCRPERSHEAAPGALEPGAYRVKRVVDGDTIVLVDAKKHVRLIGADTPETVKPNWPVEPWGPEASAFTKEFLAGGQVRLQFDGPRYDKYGRILAYVWVGDRMLNEELLRAGLARAELKYDYSASFKTRFRRAQAEAQAGHRGIWSASGPSPGNL